jgi:hypothetical protein
VTGYYRAVPPGQKPSAHRSASHYPRTYGLKSWALYASAKNGGNLDLHLTRDYSRILVIPQRDEGAVAEVTSISPFSSRLEKQPTNLRENSKDLGDGTLVDLSYHLPSLLDALSIESWEPKTLDLIG